jgi:hypothetical protein
MGSTATTRDDGPEIGQRESADSRPALGPAIISGGCAVMVALITGFFGWINRSQQPPAPSPPTLTIERPAPSLEPVQTASLDVPPRREAPRPQVPQYGLNFAAYQAAMKDRTAGDEVRKGVLDRVVGKIVIWEGVVKEVVHPQGHDADWQVTVCLVEDETFLGQSLFEHPAYCRFTTDPQNKAVKLRRGDRVTISGECESHNVVGTEVRNCHLVDVYYESDSKRK